MDIAVIVLLALILILETGKLFIKPKDNSELISRSINDELSRQIIEENTKLSE